MCGHTTALKSFKFVFVFGTHLFFFNQIDPFTFISLGNQKLLFKPIICGAGSDIRVDDIITTALSSRTGLKLYNPGHKGFLGGVTYMYYAIYLSVYMFHPIVFLFSNINPTLQE